MNFKQIDQIGKQIKSCRTPQYKKLKNENGVHTYQFIDKIGEFIKNLRPFPQRNNEQNNKLRNITYTRTKLLELKKANINEKVPDIVSTKLREIGIFKNNALKSSKKIPTIITSREQKQLTSKTKTKHYKINYNPLKEDKEKNKENNDRGNIVKIVGDGNCFFRCISHYLHGNQN